MFQITVVYKIIPHILCLIHFFPKSCPWWDNVEKYGTARQATHGNVWHVCCAWWITKARIQTHTLVMLNTYWFSMAAMVKTVSFYMYIDSLVSIFLQKVPFFFFTFFFVVDIIHDVYIIMIIVLFLTVSICFYFSVQEDMSFICCANIWLHLDFIQLVGMRYLECAFYCWFYKCKINFKVDYISNTRKILKEALLLHLTIYQ